MYATAPLGKTVTAASVGSSPVGLYAKERAFSMADRKGKDSLAAGKRATGALSADGAAEPRRTRLLPAGGDVSAVLVCVCAL